MNAPLISIIVPVYNSAEYLAECLESIQQQSFLEWECIIINDGSTDESGVIISEFIKKDERFKAYEQENSGVSAARNKGIVLAKGKYIHFVDADDYLLCDTEKTLLDHAEESKFDLLFMDYIHLKDSTCTYIHDVELKECINNPGYFDCILHTPYEYGKIMNHIFRKGGLYSTVWRVFISRQLIIENDVCFDINLRIGEDREFIKKLTKVKCRMGYIHKCLYVYRYVDNSAVHCLSDYGEPDKMESAAEYWMRTRAMYDDKKRITERLPEKLKKTALKGFRIHCVDTVISLTNRGDMMTNFAELHRLPDFKEWFDCDYILHKAGVKNRLFLLLCKMEAYKLIAFLKK